MEDLKKLQWRCRRGTLELDIICQRYLGRCYRQADPQEKAAFLQLLAMEDNELIQYLLGDAVPESEPLAKLTIKMRRLKADG